MNYQRRQDMCRDPVEGRLPFGELGLFYSNIAAK